MAKARQTPPKKNREVRPANGTGETRMADFFTVGWLLTVMMTCLCEVGAFALGVWLGRWSAGPSLELLRGILLFAAVVLGFATIVLTLLVWRVRRVPPPMGVTLFAVVVAVVPLLTVIVQSLNRR